MQLVYLAPISIRFTAFSQESAPVKASIYAEDILAFTGCTFSGLCGTYSEQSSVEGRRENTSGVDAAERSEEGEQSEGHMVAMAHTVVDPRTVVVHLHHAPVA